METAGFTGENQQQQPQRACPRCNSNNTKFCYFNNYSLTQPRYFCKGCRRYWTHGGTLRNVPVGGSSRKTKRPRSSSSAATTAPNSPLPPPEDANSVPSSTSISASPVMGSNFFQLHGGVGGGGFLSSLVVGQSMGGWPQSLIGAGSDVSAAAAVSSAQFWTLGGGGAASSASGGGDQRSNPNQWRDFPAVSGDGADDDQ